VRVCGEGCYEGFLRRFAAAAAAAAGAARAATVAAARKLERLARLEGWKAAAAGR
jgi:hypothetical protein